MASLPLTHQQTRSAGGSRSRGRLILALMVVLSIIAVGVNLQFRSSAAVAAHLDAGIRALESRRADLAEKEWRAALILDPRRTEAYHLLGELYINTERPAQAIPLLARLSQLAPQADHVLCRLAEAYARAEQPAPALDTARRAVAREPACPRAHALLGIQLGNRLDHFGAVTELSKAMVLAPGDDRITLSLAEAQLDANDLDGAEQTAQKVVSHDPGYAAAYYVLGWSYSRRTPTPENARHAMQAFEKLTQLDPSRVDSFAEIGRLRGLLGDTRGAVSALETAWKFGMHTTEVAFNLARAYRKLGDQTRANRLANEFKRLSDFEMKYDALHKTLAVSPHNLDAAQQLAELEMQSGNYTAAAPLLQTVLRERPQNIRGLQAAEKLLTGLGERQQAAFMRRRIETLISTHSTEVR